MASSAPHDRSASISQWWISTVPGVAIFMVAMATNFIGDGLRDIVDPRLR